MKKLLVLFLCALAVFAIVSCKNEPEPEKKPVAETFTVTFNAGEGVEVAPATVDKGAAVAKPAASKDGFYVAGWFTEAGFEHEYNFETPVTADITLYAKWARLIAQLTVKEGMDGLQKSEREKIQLNIDLRDSMGTDAGLKSGDVLSFKFRSSRDFYDYDVRTNKKTVPDQKIDIRWVYEGEGDTEHFVVSEPDANGWCTATYTFGAAVQRDRYTPESSEIKRDKQEGYKGPAYDTEQYYNIGLNLRGYLMTGDVVEIKDVTLTRGENAYELPLKESYNAATSYITYAGVEPHDWTIAKTYAVVYADGELYYKNKYHVEAIAPNGLATGLSEAGSKFTYFSDEDKTEALDITTAAITEDTVIYYTKSAATYVLTATAAGDRFQFKWDDLAVKAGDVITFKYQSAKTITSHTTRTITPSEKLADGAALTGEAVDGWYTFTYTIPEGKTGTGLGIALFVDGNAAANDVLKIKEITLNETKLALEQANSWAGCSPTITVE